MYLFNTLSTPLLSFGFWSPHLVSPTIKGRKNFGPACLGGRHDYPSSSFSLEAFRLSFFFLLIFKLKGRFFGGREWTMIFQV